MTDGPSPPRVPGRRARSARRRRLSYPAFGAVAALALVVGLGAAMLRDRYPAAPDMPPRPADAVPVEIAASAPAVALSSASGPVPVLETAPVAPEDAVDLDAPRARLALDPRHVTRDDLMAADRRLRAAYARAARAGVPRQVLVAYHDRWEDLREDAGGRPDRVAAGYGRMSADLERLARAQGRRPASDPLHAFLDLFS